MVIPFMLRSTFVSSPKPVIRRRLLSEILSQKRAAPAKKRVYISYSHKADAGFKKFLNTWADGSDFTFIFSSYDSGIDIESQEGRQIKARITRKMRQAEYFLALVGEHTHEDKWVSWEVTRAQHSCINLKIAAVKTNHINSPLLELPVDATSWSTAFTKHCILSALSEAR
jgi:hypothetical protein